MKRIALVFALIVMVALPMLAQVTVTGVVKDKAGEPIPGVNVVVKDGPMGTITDMNGNYVLANIPSNATLIFKFIGMQTQHIVVSGKTVINVTLQDEVSDLDEVVIVGYGAMKRAHVTGAVTSIAATDIQDIPTANLSTALEGRLAGVAISQASGKPGASTSLKIREVTSFGGIGEPPLYVIDDVVRDKDAFDILDPAEVESISILKDASASVYGVKAAGGVVLVKTKKGKEGKLKVTYSGSTGITTSINPTQMLNAYQHATMLNDGYDVQGYKVNNLNRYTDDELAYFRDSIPGGGYDWMGNVWHNASLNRHNLNFNGGTEKVNYFVGGSYLKETGNIDNLYVAKYTLRTSLDVEIAKGLNALVEVSLGNKEDMTPINPMDVQSEIMEGTFRALLQNPQWIPPTINGLPVYQNGTIANNPYAIWANNEYSKGNTVTQNVVGALTYKPEFVKGLSAKVQISQTKNHSEGKKYIVKALGYNFVTSGGHNHIIKPDAELDPATPSTIISSKEYLQESADKSYSYQTNLSLNYNRKFGRHELNAFGVCEITQSNGDRIGWVREGAQVVAGEDMAWAFAEGKDRLLSPDASKGGSLGYVGRLNYNMGSKYLAEFSFREEASSKFSPKERWGFFPSLMAGWVVSEENFFKANVPFVNYLKIRASAGMLGNEGVAAFQWMNSYNTASGFLFGKSVTTGLEAKNAGYSNPDISWQKTQMYNLGADMKFFNSKLSIGTDAFYKYTYDILASVSSKAPTTTGAPTSSFKFNYGIMHAYGYEIETKYEDKIGRDFEYSIRANFSWAMAMKLKVAQSPSAIGTWYDELKNAPDNQPGAISSGIVRNADELADILMDNPNYSVDGSQLGLGMLNYVDIRGTDGSNAPNGTFNFAQIEDRTIIAKKTTPPYLYGLTLDGGWKGIKVNMTFSGKFGHYAFYDKEAMTSPTTTTNVPAFWADHWTPTNADAAYPRAYNYGLAGNYSTFWRRNGHTLRLTDLNVGYTLPQTWSKLVGIPQFRLFFNTKYLWTVINPFNYKDANLSSYNGYPMTRTYNFGVNLSF